MKKTVFGFSDSMTKFTSSVGKGEWPLYPHITLLKIKSGLATATFDKEYEDRRRLAQRRNKPRHAMFAANFVFWNSNLHFP